MLNSMFPESETHLIRELAQGLSNPVGELYIGPEDPRGLDAAIEKLLNQNTVHRRAQGERALLPFPEERGLRIAGRSRNERVLTP